MNLFEFLRNLESFYPLNEPEEKVNKRLSSYVDILEGEIVKSGKTYNFEKVLRTIQMNYRYKQFPNLPDILDFMKLGEIKNTFDTCKDEGCLAVVTLPNGVIYPFEISPVGNQINDIKKKLTAVYGNYQLKTYPKGSVMIGTQVVAP